MSTPVFDLRALELIIDPPLGQNKRSNPVMLGPLSLQLWPGTTAVIGPNGSGKSTLLRALAGLLPEAIKMRGHLHCEGQSLASLNRRARAQRISWLAQDTQMGLEQFQTTLLTVRGLIELSDLVSQGWATPSSRVAASLGSRIDAVIQHFDLMALQHRSLGAISGGELQRAHLARVFAVHSPIMLLDEPSNHLDLKHQAKLESSIHAHALEREGLRRAVIYTTHDLNLALQADVLVLLPPGQPAMQLNLASVSESQLQSNLESTFGTPLRVFTETDGRRRAYRMSNANRA